MAGAPPARAARPLEGPTFQLVPRKFYQRRIRGTEGIHRHELPKRLQLQAPQRPCWNLSGRVQ